MRLLLSMLALSTLSACADTKVMRSTPDWDSRFGANTRATLAQQIIDPGAARNAAPATGMDGRAAQAAYERYQRTFSATTQPAPTFIINSGTK
jgi:hypothetical protein